jgi:hypothetical protein
MKKLLLAVFAFLLSFTISIQAELLKAWKLYEFVNIAIDNPIAFKEKFENKGVKIEGDIMAIEPKRMELNGESVQLYIVEMLHSYWRLQFYFKNKDDVINLKTSQKITIYGGIVNINLENKEIWLLDCEITN